MTPKSRSQRYAVDGSIPQHAQGSCCAADFASLMIHAFSGLPPLAVRMDILSVGGFRAAGPRLEPKDTQLGMAAADVWRVSSCKLPFLFLWACLVLQLGSYLLGQLRSRCVSVRPVLFKMLPLQTHPHRRECLVHICLSLISFLCLSLYCTLLLCYAPCCKPCI